MTDAHLSEAVVRRILHMAIEKQTQAVRDLEAKLAENEVRLGKAVDTLMFYGGVMPNAFLPIQDGGEKARATLAEIEGLGVKQSG